MHATRTNILNVWWSDKTLFLTQLSSPVTFAKVIITETYENLRRTQYSHAMNRNNYI